MSWTWTAWTAAEDWSARVRRLEELVLEAIRHAEGHPELVRQLEEIHSRIMLIRARLKRMRAIWESGFYSPMGSFLDQLDEGLGRETDD